jgi:hypothetical protein
VSFKTSGRPPLDGGGDRLLDQGAVAVAAFRDAHPAPVGPTRRQMVRRSPNKVICTIPAVCDVVMDPTQILGILRHLFVLSRQRWRCWPSPAVVMMVTWQKLKKNGR